MEELFVRQVDIGVAEMDVAVGDQLSTTRVVVEHATATDGRGGPDRQLLLVYGAEETPRSPRPCSAPRRRPPHPRPFPAYC